MFLVSSTTGAIFAEFMSLAESAKDLDKARGDEIFSMKEIETK